MSQTVKLDGHTIVTHSMQRRTVVAEDGSDRVQLDVNVMVRGRPTQRAFAQLVQRATLRFEQPPEPAFEVEVIERAMTPNGGSGEHAIARFDLGLRETATVAAARRAREAAEAAARRAVAPAPAQAPGHDRAGDISDVPLAANETIWATALRQVGGDRFAAPVPEPEPEPLTTAELAGVDTVLVGLRLEALITELERVGALDRRALDARFMRLLDERFVDEATPIVGEPAANRAARDVLAER